MELCRVGDGWKGWLDEEWLDMLGGAPFLERCRDATISRAEMCSFLKQHYFYSRNFTRFLCSLIGNLPHGGDRKDLMDNLFEEMGLANGHTIPHSRMYAEMLHELKIHPQEWDILPSTQRFVAAMHKASRSDDYLVGLGALCLGAEAIVPYLYSRILEGCRHLDMETARLRYFQVHIECDDEHAITMRRILDREAGTDPARREIVRSAGLRIIKARLGFFQGIISQRIPLWQEINA